ncbi:MAG: PTS sugar transporter subunit IIA [Pseudomonadota bacterium]
MDMNAILRPEAVKAAPSFTSKKRLFHELGDMAAAQVDVPASAVVEALLDRESLGPTGVGGGIALPHARLNGLETVTGFFIRCSKAFDFDAADRKPVDLIFALLAPAGAGVEHLKALALVSRTMREADLCTKLRANSDPVALHAMLTEAKRSQAA